VGVRKERTAVTVRKGWAYAVCDAGILAGGAERKSSSERVGRTIQNQGRKPEGDGDEQQLGTKRGLRRSEGAVGAGFLDRA
jgi:hypothetical protein